MTVTTDELDLLKIKAETGSEQKAEVLGIASKTSGM
jgi:hypothetical protein